MQGRWVYLDGQKNGIFTKHSLALSYAFGPIGFLSHLVTRTAYRVVKPGVQDIMEVRSYSSDTLQVLATFSHSKFANPRWVVSNLNVSNLTFMQ